MDANFPNGHSLQVPGMSILSAASLEWFYRSLTKLQEHTLMIPSTLAHDHHTASATKNKGTGLRIPEWFPMMRQQRATQYSPSRWQWVVPLCRLGHISPHVQPPALQQQISEHKTQLSTACAAPAGAGCSLNSNFFHVYGCCHADEYICVDQRSVDALWATPLHHELWTGVHSKCIDALHTQPTM
jgi:hypothetical protein